ncbi:hypothetical protein Glove_151g179 [Diversispora epigaea]|uniref:Uncharacterized protein n=1 Tax=Diversispora epigaea TaxID=1348612 RepID=A0A397J2K1_9GLOM|nr:hypothetical protein Glove_151g179 [Diversispora epigaea]
MCHGQAGTIVDNLKSGYMETNYCFIFSLTNGNTQNSILSRVKDGNNVLYYRNSNDQNIYGPEFGICEFIMKLILLKINNVGVD